MAYFFVQRRLFSSIFPAAAPFFEEVMKMNSFPELMTSDEVAKLFGVSKRTVARWVDTIPSFPIPVSPEGTPLRFIREEIFNYFYRGRKHE
ncbi:helix-turn-helix domain-containing protein [Escherichia coli]|uniref:helix-turn-helix domain-containing protein n=1 Tax=Escherichia TaxID=561 RepID=UPI00288A7754|nr:helix-turn-helix domain-containing protein [Escherichia coli]